MIHTLVPVMSLSALLICLGSWWYTLTVNGRLVRAQKRAHDYAADVMARAFGIELAARRAIAVWELGGWCDAKLGTPTWEQMADVMDALHRELEAADDRVAS